MKKYILGLALLIAIIPNLSLASIDYNLKYGMRNKEVSELQDFLSESGYMNQSTGFFGLITLNAVKKFQLDNSIPSTGYVGILTRTEINSQLSVATASSTEAEVQETGSSTPIVNPTIIYQIPQTSSNNQTANISAPTPVITTPLTTVSIGDQECILAYGNVDKKPAFPVTITGDYTHGVMMIHPLDSDSHFSGGTDLWPTFKDTHYMGFYGITSGNYDLTVTLDNSASTTKTVSIVPCQQ